MYAFTLRKLNAGSDKYGLCEVCGQHTDTTYIMSRMKRYHHPIRHTEGLAHVSGTFGHKTCLSELTNH